MTKSYEELLADMTGIIAKIYEKGFDKGYEQGKMDAEMVAGFKALGKAVTDSGITLETNQEKRDRIVERAKADIDSLKGRRRGARYGSIDDLYHISDGSYSGSYVLKAKFIVNKHKRTVVALMYGAFSNRMRARGIAKCAPDDCFNEHIGKAIALRRALGLEVPDEYLNAPQPTEVRVGDVVYLKTSALRIPYTRVISKVSNDYITYTNGGEDSIKHVYKNGRIIDDSREEDTE